MPLTEEQIEKLTSDIVGAKEALETGRAEMINANEKVGKLLEEQKVLKDGSAAHGQKLDSVETTLTDLGGRMTTLAEQHTNLTERVRTQMKVLGTDGGNEQTAFRYRHPKAKGSIFESRQQALELGMFFMATMKPHHAVREQARVWLKAHKNELRYLPNVPSSLYQDLGEEWMEKYNAIQEGQLWAQDLTGGTTPGSVLTRPEFANALIRNVEEYGVFRRDALVWPMGSDTVYIPRRQTGFSIYWEGEGDTATESDPDFQMLAMTAKKAMMYHEYSSELSEDAAIALADILMFEFAWKQAYEEDRIGFNGDGSGGSDAGFAGFIGLLGAAAHATAATADSSHVPHLVTGTAGNDLTTELTTAKLREITGRLHTWAQNAKWYMHRSVHADCDGIQMGTGGGSVVSYQDPSSARIMGHPIEDVEALPASPSAASTKVLALGDLRKAWILGDRRRMEIATSEHYQFKSDLLAVRTTVRLSFLMVAGEAMVIYKTGTA